jgi:hypothetical protein
MRCHVPIIIALLCVGCGDTQTSPSTPRPPVVQPPAGAAVTIRGEVRDTTNFPISEAQVQVLTGPRAGSIAVTDRDGQFSMVLSDGATVRVSKEGFHETEKAVPASNLFVRFDLEAIDAPIVIAGIYEMTLTAANECRQLPNVARQRTYRAQVAPENAPSHFTAAVLDGDFPYNRYFLLAVRRDEPRTLRVDLGWDWFSGGLVERVKPEMFLEISGTIDLPLGARSAAAAFEGAFALCLAESRNPISRCPVQPVTCQSANHRLAWTRQ